MPKRHALFIAIMLGLVPTAVSAQEEPEEGAQVEGAMVGGTVSLGTGGNASFGPSVQFWTDYLGLRLGMSLSRLDASLTSDGSKIDTDSKEFEINGQVLFGFPMERAKPYFVMGLAYASQKGTTSFGGESASTKLTGMGFMTGLGIDFLAAPHVTIGVGLLELDVILDGEMKIGDSTAEMDGFGIELFNSLSVRYVF